MPEYTYEHESLQNSKRRSDVQEVALALHEVAYAIRSAAWSLGMRDACTPMGALEQLGDAIIKTGEKVGEALEGLGQSLQFEMGEVVSTVGKAEATLRDVAIVIEERRP